MQIAGLIFDKLIQFFLMMLMGMVTVKAGILKKCDLKVLSTLCIYIVMPCAIIKSFQVAYTQETISGLQLSFGAAIGINLIYGIVVYVFNRFYRMTKIEMASVLYPNAGILVLPLVSSVFGEQWVIYSTGYLTIQTVLLFTHARALVSGTWNFSLKAILKNINILAVIAGLVLFLTGIRLPGALYETVSQVSSLLGPVSMISMGILMGGMDLKKNFGTIRTYQIVLIRLVILPLIYLGILCVGGRFMCSENANMILYSSFLAAMMPAATTITQFAQVFASDEDAECAGAVNVVSTLLCLVTIPILTWLYWILI